MAAASPTSPPPWCMRLTLCCAVWFMGLLHLQVSEQVDSLRVLFTDPVDYLVTPRVLASMIAGPILNVLCFCMGASSCAYGCAWWCLSAGLTAFTAMPAKHSSLHTHGLAMLPLFMYCVTKQCHL